MATAVPPVIDETFMACASSEANALIWRMGRRWGPAPTGLRPRWVPTRPALTTIAVLAVAAAGATGCRTPCWRRSSAPN